MGFAVLERSELCATLRRTDPGAPTLCGDWTAAQLTAHMVQRERSVTEMLGRLPVARLRARAESRLSELVTTQPYLQLVDALDAGPPHYSPWAIPALRESVNLVEYTVHHEDVRRAEPGVTPRQLDPARQRAIWQQLRRSAPLLMRNVDVGVRLNASGIGTAATGKAKRGGPGSSVVTVTGEPVELALLVMGRQGVAQVEYDGPPESIDILRGADLSI